MKTWVRAVATGTVFCFLATQSVFANPGASIEIAGTGELPSSLNLDIPAELATIDELYEAPNQADPKFILHIQDAHANYEAQCKIKELLSYLNQKYGINTVFVEGASEKLDADYIRLFKDEASNRKLGVALAKQGELSGTELYLLEAGKDFEALGIEDISLYKQNYATLKTLYGASDDVDRFFNGFDLRLAQVASRIFSPETREMITDWRNFEKGRREFLPYVKTLVRKAKTVLQEDLESLFAQVGWPQITRLLTIQMMETDLNRTQAFAEREALVKFLREKRVSKALIESIAQFHEGNISFGRPIPGKEQREILPRYLLEQLVAEAGPKGFRFSDYPNFSLYAGYVVLKGELDAKALFDEIEYLFSKMLDTMVQEATQKKILELYRDGELLRKLLYLELNRDAWRKVRERRNVLEIDSMVARLQEAVDLSKGQGTVPRQVISQEFSRRMTELTATGFKFYEFACQRENVFFQQMRSAMAERKIRKAVLITGGFHTSGLSDLFRENDTSYGIVTPRLSEKSNENLYKTSMLQNRNYPFNVSYLAKFLPTVSLKSIEAEGGSVPQAVAGLLDQAMSTGNRDVPEMVTEANQSPFARRNEIRLVVTGKDIQGHSRISIVPRTEMESLGPVTVSFGKITPPLALPEPATVAVAQRSEIRVKATIKGVFAAMSAFVDALFEEKPQFVNLHTDYHYNIKVTGVDEPTLRYRLRAMRFKTKAINNIVAAVMSRASLSDIMTSLNGKVGYRLVGERKSQLFSQILKSGLSSTLQKARYRYPMPGKMLLVHSPFLKNNDMFFMYRDSRKSARGAIRFSRIRLNKDDYTTFIPWMSPVFRKEKVMTERRLDEGVCTREQLPREAALHFGFIPRSEMRKGDIYEFGGVRPLMPRTTFALSVILDIWFSLWLFSPRLKSLDSFLPGGVVLLSVMGFGGIYALTGLIGNWIAGADRLGRFSSKEQQEMDRNARAEVRQIPFQVEVPTRSEVREKEPAMVATGLAWDLISVAQDAGLSGNGIMTEDQVIKEVRALMDAYGDPQRDAAGLLNQFLMLAYCATNWWGRDRTVSLEKILRTVQDQGRIINDPRVTEAFSSQLHDVAKRGQALQESGFAGLKDQSAIYLSDPAQARTWGPGVVFTYMPIKFGIDKIQGYLNEPNWNKKYRPDTSKEAVALYQLFSDRRLVPEARPTARSEARIDLEKYKWFQQMTDKALKSTLKRRVKEVEAAIKQQVKVGADEEFERFCSDVFNVITDPAERIQALEIAQEIPLLMAGDIKKNRDLGIDGNFSAYRKLLFQDESFARLTDRTERRQVWEIAKAIPVLHKTLGWIAFRALWEFLGEEMLGRITDPAERKLIWEIAEEFSLHSTTTQIVNGHPLISFGKLIGGEGFGSVKDPAIRQSILDILRSLLPDWRDKTREKVEGFNDALSSIGSSSVDGAQAELSKIVVRFSDQAGPGITDTKLRHVASQVYTDIVNFGAQVAALKSRDQQISQEGPPTPGKNGGELWMEQPGGTVHGQQKRSEVRTQVLSPYPILSTSLKLTVDTALKELDRLKIPFPTVGKFLRHPIRSDQPLIPPMSILVNAVSSVSERVARERLIRYIEEATYSTGATGEGMIVSKAESKDIWVDPDMKKFIDYFLLLLNTEKIAPADLRPILDVMDGFTFENDSQWLQLKQAFDARLRAADIPGLSVPLKTGLGNVMVKEYVLSLVNVLSGPLKLGKRSEWSAFREYISEAVVVQPANLAVGEETIVKFARRPEVGTGQKRSEVREPLPVDLILEKVSSQFLDKKLAAWESANVPADASRREKLESLLATEAQSKVPVGYIGDMLEQESFGTEDSISAYAFFKGWVGERTEISSEELFKLLLEYTGNLKDPAGNPYLTAQQKAILFEQLFPVLLLGFSGLTRRYTGSPRVFHLLRNAMIDVQQMIETRIVDEQIPEGRAYQSQWVMDMIVASLFTHIFDEANYPYSDIHRMGFVSPKAFRRIENLSKEKIAEKMGDVTLGIEPPLTEGQRQQILANQLWEDWKVSTRENAAGLQLAPKNMVARYAGLLDDLAEASWLASRTQTAQAQAFVAEFRKKMFGNVNKDGSLEPESFKDSYMYLMVYHPGLPVAEQWFVDLANHFLARVRSVSGLSEAVLPALQAVEVLKKETKTMQERILGAMNRIAGPSQAHAMQYGEFYSQLETIMKDPTKSTPIARALFAAYYTETNQPVPDFDPTDENYLINIAGFYATQEAALLIAQIRGVDPQVVFDEIATGKIFDAGHENDLLVFMRFAHATWLEANARKVARTTRSLVKPAASLPVEELVKDVTQFRISTDALRKQMQVLTDEMKKREATARSEARGNPLKEEIAGLLSLKTPPVMGDIWKRMVEKESATAFQEMDSVYKNVLAAMDEATRNAALRVRNRFISWVAEEIRAGVPGEEANAIGWRDTYGNGEAYGMAIRLLGDDRANIPTLFMTLEMALRRDQMSGADLHKKDIGDALLQMLGHKGANRIISKIIAGLEEGEQNPWSQFDGDGSLAEINRKLQESYERAAARTETRIGPVIVERQELAASVMGELARRGILEKAKVRLLEPGDKSLEDVVAEIVVPSEGKLAANNVADMLEALVAIKAGELDWEKFLTLAQSILKNPALVISDAPGATIIALNKEPTGLELEDMAMQLAMNTGQVVCYVLGNRDGAQWAALKLAVRKVQKATDFEGKRIGDRFGLAFCNGEKIEDVARRVARKLESKDTQFKNGAYLTYLVSEGMAPKFDLKSGTVMESRKDEPQNASVRNLLAMKTAQISTSAGDPTVAALLNKQIGEAVIVLLAKYLGIEGDRLGALAKLWAAMMEVRATSVSA